MIDLYADCGRVVRTLRGLHRHFCELGFSAFADISRLKPYLESIGASLLRIGVVEKTPVFKGTTLDETDDPARYDFSRIDWLVAKTVDAGLEPFVILPIPSGQQSDGNGRAVDINVVKEVARHIVLHLTQGWADGHFYPIRYWEVGNEPDLDVFGPSSWSVEGYGELLGEVAQALHTIECVGERSSHKVGGPSLAFPKRDWGERLIQYCDVHAIPLDFFSFHIYQDEPEAYERIINNVERCIRQFPRYRNTELIVNEWNVISGIDIDEWKTRYNESYASKDEFDKEFIYALVCHPKFLDSDTTLHSAAALTYMEKSSVSKGGHFLLADNGRVKMGVIACPGSYVPGFIDPPSFGSAETSEPYYPRPKYHVLRLFEELYKARRIVHSDVRVEKLDALCCASLDGTRLSALLVNRSEERSFRLLFDNLPWAKSEKSTTSFNWQLDVFDTSVTSDNDPIETAEADHATGWTFEAEFTLPAKSVALLQLTLNQQSEDHAAHARPYRDQA